MTNRTLIKLSVLLSLLSIIICLTPDPARRTVRHWLANTIMWQWKRGSLVSARLYSALWQKGNGK